MRPAAAVIADPEWRFDRVPEDELETCLLYEFGRESKAFREKVEAWREKNPRIMQAARALLKTAASCKDSVREFIGSLRDGSWRTKAKVFADGGDGTQGTDNSLTEWMQLRVEAGGAFPEMDARSGKWFLHVFPPFPEKPWLEIESEGVRKNAFDLFMFHAFEARERLAQWIWTLGREYSVEISRQKYIQAHSCPMSDAEVEEMVRASAAGHIFTPGIVEAKGGWGALPAGAQWDQNFERVWVDGIVHQEVKFIVNWGRSDKTIKKEFSGWLKRQRPGPELKVQNVASAQEHLRQLGALRLTKLHTLQEAHSLIEAVDYPDEGKPLYSSESALLVASGKASKALSRMFAEG